MKPGLSIIIPTKGPVEALNRTLINLLNCQKSENFEVIVINDGGGAAIRQYLEKLKQEGWQICRIENPVSLGSYAARNQGIKKAKGDWLLFADDDLSIPGNWISQVKPFLKDYDFICCNVQVESKKFNKISKKYHKSIGFNAKIKFEQFYFALTGFLLVHNQIFSALGVFDDQLYAGGDYIFSQKVANSKFKMVFLEELVLYHQPKSWKKQFYTMCRINKGKIQKAKRYPELCGKEAINAKDLLRTIKYLLNNLIHYRQTYFYQHSNVGFWKHEIGQFIYYSLYFCSQLLVLLSPNKRFNW